MLTNLHRVRRFAPQPGVWVSRALAALAKLTNNQPPRLSIYVDGRNIWHGCESVGVAGYLDFWKLAALLVPNGRLQAVNYYDCALDQSRSPHEYADQRRFIAHLRNRPDATVRLGTIGRRHGGQRVHKGVDTKLTTDLLVHAFNDQYDIALVVSGDSDFADPMYAVRAQGKTVECAYVKRPLQRTTASPRTRCSAARLDSALGLAPRRDCEFCTSLLMERELGTRTRRSISGRGRARSRGARAAHYRSRTRRPVRPTPAR